MTSGRSRSAREKWAHGEQPYLRFNVRLTRDPFHFLWLIPLAAGAVAFAALSHASALSRPAFSGNAADLARQQDAAALWSIISVAALGIAIFAGLAIPLAWIFRNIRRANENRRK